MYSFKNLGKPKNTVPGVAEFFLFAPKSWFNIIQSPNKNNIGVGDEVIIYDAHEFKTGLGFLDISLAPLKNQFIAKVAGDLANNYFAQELKIFIPGSYALLHEMFKKIANDPLIVLIKDATCAENMYYQLGCECSGAYVSGNFTTSTTNGTVKGYEVVISWSNDAVQLYQGEIIKFDPSNDTIVALGDGTGYLIDSNGNLIATG